MCKYCACELSKSQLSKLCEYTKDSVVHNVPWINEGNTIVEYQPSNSLQVNNGLPVLIDGKHLQYSAPQIFCPMYWSLISPYYTGPLQDWESATYNARFENLFEKKMFSASLNQGRRCVIVFEGFYEHKKRDAYYFQSLDNKLLKAAGLFNITKREDGRILYSCSIITTSSKNNVKDIHYRSPLLLHEDAAVEAWLSFQAISSADALHKIGSTEPINLKYYKVDKIGSREAAKPKKTLASKNVMENWLVKGVKRKAED